MRILTGIAVSPGIAIGPVLVLDSKRLRLPRREIAPEDVEREIHRLDEALERARVDAEQAQDHRHHVEQGESAGGQAGRQRDRQRPRDDPKCRHRPLLGGNELSVKPDCL